MMDAVRSWLVSVICTAMAVAVAESIAPPGGMKKIVSLTGEFLLLLVLVQPLEDLRPDAFHLEYDVYRQSVERQRQELEKEQKKELQTLIEQQTAAYISDKARNLGLDCRVTVCCKVGEEGVPYPDSVTVEGAASEELGAWITQELNIPTERQVFHGVEE